MVAEIGALQRQPAVTARLGRTVVTTDRCQLQCLAWRQNNSVANDRTVSARVLQVSPRIVVRAGFNGPTASFVRITGLVMDSQICASHSASGYCPPMHPSPGRSTHAGHGTNRAESWNRCRGATLTLTPGPLIAMAKATRTVDLESMVAQQRQRKRLH